jgi:hypothetical protein
MQAHPCAPTARRRRPRGAVTTIRCSQPDVGIDQQHDASSRAALCSRRTQRVSVGGSPIRVTRVERPHKRRQRPRLISGAMSPQMVLDLDQRELINADTTTDRFCSKPLSERIGNLDRDRHNQDQPTDTDRDHPPLRPDGPKLQIALPDVHTRGPHRRSRPQMIAEHPMQTRRVPHRDGLAGMRVGRHQTPSTGPFEGVVDHHRRHTIVTTSHPVAVSVIQEPGRRRPLRRAVPVPTQDATRPAARSVKSVTIPAAPTGGTGASGALTRFRVQRRSASTPRYMSSSRRVTASMR